MRKGRGSFTKDLTPETAGTNVADQITKLQSELAKTTKEKDDQILGLQQELYHQEEHGEELNNRIQQSRRRLITVQEESEHRRRQLQVAERRAEEAERKAEEAQAHISSSAAQLRLASAGKNTNSTELMIKVKEQEVKMQSQAKTIADMRAQLAQKGNAGPASDNAHAEVKQTVLTKLRSDLSKEQTLCEQQKNAYLELKKHSNNIETEMSRLQAKYAKLKQQVDINPSTQNSAIPSTTQSSTGSANSEVQLLAVILWARNTDFFAEWTSSRAGRREQGKHQTLQQRPRPD